MSKKKGINFLVLMFALIFTFNLYSVSALYEKEYTDNLNLVISKDSVINWKPNSLGSIESIFFTGEYTGNGQVDIYIETEQEPYLLFSTNKPSRVEHDCIQTCNGLNLNQTSYNLIIEFKPNTQGNERLYLDSLHYTARKSLKEIIAPIIKTPSFNKKESSGINVYDLNVLDLSQLDSFTIGSFNLDATYQGKILNLALRDSNNILRYKFSNITDSKLLRLEFDDEVEHVLIKNIPTSRKQNTFGLDPKYYDGKVEKVLFDDNVLEKEDYFDEEKKIPVIINLDLEMYTNTNNINNNTNTTNTNNTIIRTASSLSFQATNLNNFEDNLTQEEPENNTIEANFDSVRDIVLDEIKQSRSTTKKALIQSSSISTQNSVDVEHTNLRLIDSFSTLLDKEEIQALKNNPYIKKISLDKKVYAVLQDSVSLIGGTQLWTQNNLTGKGIKIAVIDTGVDYTHPDFGSCDYDMFSKGECPKVAGGYDVYNSDPDPMDDQGHGTHCAGIAASNGTLKGVAPDAIIYAYKVLSSSGSGSFSTVIGGIELATDPNGDGDYSDRADIISMSLGGYGHPDDDVSRAADLAVERGVAVVVAAGNSGPSPNTIGSPGCARKVITVGASCKPSQVGVSSECDSLIADFSSRGPTSIGEIKPDILAPGVDICASQHEDSWSESQCRDDEHTAISGTSMATPHVAGAIALMLENEILEPEVIKSHLTMSANDLGFKPAEQGHGQINITHALDIDFTASPRTIFFNEITDETHLYYNITVTNIRNYSISLGVDTTSVKDEAGTEYDIAVTNVSNLALEPLESTAILLNITLGSVTGDLQGFVTFNLNGRTYLIPFIFSRYAYLNVDIIGPDYSYYPDFILHSEDFLIKRTVLQGFDFYGGSYQFKLPIGNYTVYAAGDYYDEDLEYLLMTNYTLSSLGEYNLTFNKSDARVYNISSRSKDNLNLNIYDWKKGFISYDDTNAMRFISKNEDYLYTDRLVSVSNRPSPLFNTDILFLYHGVPYR